MTSAGSFALYGSALLAVGLPPAWLTSNECQRVADPARLKTVKRHVAAAITWDLLLAYLAAAVVFGGQRFASFGLNSKLTRDSSPGRGTALVALVSVLVASTGLVARHAGRRVGREHRRTSGGIDVRRGPSTAT